MFSCRLLLFFSVILELGAGHVSIHVLCSGTSDLVIAENRYKTIWLVFNVVFAVPASASDPHCHVLFTSLFFQKLIVASPKYSQQTAKRYKILTTVQPAVSVSPIFSRVGNLGGQNQ